MVRRGHKGSLRRKSASTTTASSSAEQGSASASASAEQQQQQHHHMNGSNSNNTGMVGVGSGSGSGSGIGGSNIGTDAAYAYDKCRNNESPCCNAVRDVVRDLFPEVEYLESRSKNNDDTNNNCNSGNGSNGSSKRTHPPRENGGNVTTNNGGRGGADRSLSSSTTTTTTTRRRDTNASSHSTTSTSGEGTSTLFSLMVRDYLLKDYQRRVGKTKVKPGSTNTSANANASNGGNGSAPMTKSQKKRRKRNKKQNSKGGRGGDVTSTTATATTISSATVKVEGTRSNGKTSVIEQNQKESHEESSPSSSRPSHNAKLDSFLHKIIHEIGSGMDNHNENIPPPPSPLPSPPQNRTLESLLEYIHERYIQQQKSKLQLQLQLQSSNHNQSSKIQSGGKGGGGGGRKNRKGSSASALLASASHESKSSSTSKSKSNGGTSRNSIMPSIPLSEIYNIVAKIHCRRCEYSCTHFLNRVSYHASPRYGGASGSGSLSPGTSEEWGSGHGQIGNHGRGIEVDWGGASAGRMDDGNNGAGCDASENTCTKVSMIRLDRESVAIDTGSNHNDSFRGGNSMRRSSNSSSGLTIPVSGYNSFDSPCEDMDIEHALGYELMEEGDGFGRAASASVSTDYDSGDVNDNVRKGIELNFVWKSNTGQGQGPKHIELNTANLNERSLEVTSSEGGEKSDPSSPSLVFSMDDFECMIKDVIIPCGLPEFNISNKKRDEISQQAMQDVEHDSNILFKNCSDAIQGLEFQLVEMKNKLDEAEEVSLSSSPFNPKANASLLDCSKAQLRYMELVRQLLINLDDYTLQARIYKHDEQKWVKDIMGGLWDAYETCMRSMVEPSLQHIWKVIQLGSNRSGSVPLSFNSSTQREYRRTLLRERLDIINKLHQEMNMLMLPEMKDEGNLSVSCPLLLPFLTIGAYINIVSGGTSKDYKYLYNNLLKLRGELICEVILQTNINEIMTIKSDKCSSMLQEIKKATDRLDESVDESEISKSEKITLQANRIMIEESLIDEEGYENMKPSLEHDLEYVEYLCDFVNKVVVQGRFCEELNALHASPKSEVSDRIPMHIQKLCDTMPDHRAVITEGSSPQLKCEGGGGRRRIAGILSVYLYKWLQEQCLEWHADLTRKELLVSAEEELTQEADARDAQSTKTSKKKKKRKKKASAVSKNRNESDTTRANSAELLPISDPIPKAISHQGENENKEEKISPLEQSSQQDTPQLIEALESVDNNDSMPPEEVVASKRANKTRHGKKEVRSGKSEKISRGEKDLRNERSNKSSNGKKEVDHKRSNKSLNGKREVSHERSDKTINGKKEVSNVGVLDRGQIIPAEQYLCQRYFEALKGSNVRHL